MQKVKVASGATVLDPFMGSGTTGIACIRSGRKFIGTELKESYYKTAVKNLVEAEHTNIGGNLLQFVHGPAA
jgi:DNA modification methylase